MSVNQFDQPPFTDMFVSSFPSPHYSVTQPVLVIKYVMVVTGCIRHMRRRSSYDVPLPFPPPHQLRLVGR